MSNIICTQVLPTAENAVDTITLDQAGRHRRRRVMTSDTGLSFLLDLPTARLLHDGDGLRLSDGRLIEVRAAAEPLMEIRGTSPRHLNALAWQIGNRHLTAQIEDDRILIERDLVIANMLAGLGAKLRDVEEPFHPEGGAYGDHSHSHSHSHSHD
ncbi:MAG: urease accessory protein UreE [Pseudomonadota bacterium]